MKNIKISAMAYEQARYYTLDSENFVNVAINVSFTLGDLIQGTINIPIEFVSEMDETKVQEFIYKYINQQMERKFIDEI